MTVHKTWTRSATMIDLIEPLPKEINLADIVYPLSYMPRYAGQSYGVLSVAAHSLILSKLVPRPLKLAALLHDAAEAYTGDIVQPVKRLLPAAALNVLKKVEVWILKAIEEHLEISFLDEFEAVLQYDAALAEFEMFHFYGRQPAETATGLFEANTALSLISRAVQTPPQRIAVEFLVALLDLSGKGRGAVLSVLDQSTFKE